VHTGLWWGGGSEGKRPLGNPKVGGRILLKWISESGMGKHGLD